jgi:hypothetical protein
MAIHTSTTVAKCDACNHEMTQREFDKQVDCYCKVCWPQIFCKGCHERS